jgi:intracellular sulfur oxidation DsrE/DsrF family protein
MHLLNSRRQFFGRLLGAAAGGASLGAVAQVEAAQTSTGPATWLANMKGTNRAFFDFPQHKAGVPLLHILNYFNGYQTAMGAGAGQVSAVGTFYGIGGQSSIPLAFNDAMWAKYELGAYTGMKTADGKPYTRNVMHRPQAGDTHLLMQAMQVPHIAMFDGVMPAIGIESLQKMGTTFLMCNNAFVGWCAELDARGKGKAANLEAELRANLLPGIVVVPAMVIAIEQAQRAGIAYNRQ